jgi:hypothetical protein
MASYTYDSTPRRSTENGALPWVDDIQDLRLQRSMLHAVAYSDIFDYPLTATEIHRYLVGVATSTEVVRDLLVSNYLVPRYLDRSGDFYTLSGRSEIVSIRRSREDAAGRLWPIATYYGRMITRLPFVRMVAVTGELAVNNVNGKSDVDYFIVTEPGRLWLTRAMVIAIVKAAERRGIVVCPNYLITENALEMDERNLYTAREMAQMVPLSGYSVYERLREINDWVLEYLPNAIDPPVELNGSDSGSQLRRVSEAVLRTPLAERFEQWEMKRKIEKLSRQNGTIDEVAFSADWCKGHFDGHGHRTMQAFAERVRMVEGLMR